MDKFEATDVARDDESDVVLRLMPGEPVESLSRRLGLPVYKLEDWRQRDLAGIDAGLRERDGDLSAQARGSHVFLGNGDSVIF